MSWAVAKSLQILTCPQIGRITAGCDPGMWLKLAGMPAAKTQIYSQGETNTFMMIKQIHSQGGGKKEIYSQGVARCDRGWYSNGCIIAHSYV